MPEVDIERPVWGVDEEWIHDHRFSESKAGDVLEAYSKNRTITTRQWSLWV